MVGGAHGNVWLFASSAFSLEKIRFYVPTGERRSQLSRVICDARGSSAAPRPRPTDEDWRGREIRG